METLDNLPDIAGRRFGNVTIGYDRVDRIRMEVATLETLASLVCGCPREGLTLAKVQSTLADMQSRVAALTDEERAEWRDEDPKKLLAMAISMMPT